MSDSESQMEKEAVETVAPETPVQDEAKQATDAGQKSLQEIQSKPAKAADLLISNLDIKRLI